MTATAPRETAELPPLNGLYRTPFGFYVPDHKAPTGKQAVEMWDWLYREGTPPIPNTQWSRVATMTKQELAAIENLDIREETCRAQELMLEYPAQLVGLIAIGNEILYEPTMNQIRFLQKPLRGGHIEVYDHDASRIRIGKPQEMYNSAKLWVDKSADDDAVLFAVRGGGWSVGDRRFSVHLHYGPRHSPPHVAGLGFKPSGNEAYVGPNVNELLEGLADIETQARLLREKL